jgi:hypothetical protein
VKSLTGVIHPVYSGCMTPAEGRARWDARYGDQYDTQEAADADFARYVEERDFFEGVLAAAPPSQADTIAGMTPTRRLANLGEQAIAIIVDLDHEMQVVFGRESHFTQEQRDRLIAESLRRLVADYQWAKEEL